ncbi:MAG: bifunctional demethylmenaquinone methyltransferase/2-methoxy-6-polyprenyl-1,4-benzoquinol methylase UbiE [Candidatus Tyrphobacter sp.]
MGSSATPSAPKSVYVREMFARIAPRYDVANRVLTAGFDELWRRRAIALLAPPRGGSVLDLCCGTGDLVFHLLRGDPTLSVTGADFCAPMLERARARARRLRRGAPQFVQADVAALPFANDSFDGATMGFSLRNVVDIEEVLREILRVLRPGARFVNLDVGKPRNALWRRCFGLYFYGVVPVLGGIVGGSRQAYSYLPSSLTHHPDAPALAAHFERAGFAAVRYVGLAGGAIAIHVGTKPEAS